MLAVVVGFSLFSSLAWGEKGVRTASVSMKSPSLWILPVNVRVPNVVLCAMPSFGAVWPLSPERVVCKGEESDPFGSTYTTLFTELAILERLKDSHRCVSIALNRS